MFMEMLPAVSNIIHYNNSRTHALDLPEILLPILLLLRSYPCYTLLSLIFGLSCTTISREIYIMWPKLWHVYASKIE